jgi:uncharacterized membrane protein
MLMGKENLGEIESRYLHDLAIHYNANSIFADMGKELFGRQTPEDSTETMVLENQIITQPMAYLPQAIGITAGRILKLNLYRVYQLGRLLNLITYICMVLIAVKLASNSRHIMIFAGIMPMALHQAVSLSGDAFIYGLSLILFALFLKAISERKVFTWKQVLIWICLLAVMVAYQPACCALGLLIFSIPDNLFEDKKDRILKTAALLLACVYAVLLLWVPAVSHAPQNGVYAVGDYYTLSFAAENPFRFLRMTWLTLSESFIDLLRQTAGSRLAGLTLALPDYLSEIYLVILTLAMVTGTDAGEGADKRRRYVPLVVSMVGVFLIVAECLCRLTIYGSTVVTGLQGRFLITFLLPLLYGFATGKIRSEYDPNGLMIPVWFLYLVTIFEAMSRVAYGI